MKKLISSAWIAATVMASQVVPAFGQGSIEIKQPKEVQITNIGTLISGLISLIFIVAAIIFFFMLVIGGVQWMLSGGDKQATEAARNRITAALIGLIIVFAAWAIMKLIESFFGIKVISGEITLPKFY